jgi:uncharacterized spore protein YtfJ
MSINKLFAAIEDAKNTANVNAAFGEPQAVEEKTIIPVAQVGYGFGLGFGQGPVMPGEEDEEGSPGEATTSGEGGGGGGGATARPLGVLVVTPEHVYFEETMDEAKIALAGIAFVTLAIVQIAKTLTAIFGRD